MINIEEKLKKAEPTSLSDTEKSEVLRYIKSDIEDIVEDSSKPYLSISTYRNMKKKLLMKIVAGTLIFTGSIATAFASNDARPGDILFTVDRAIENLQLALTTDDGREAELKLQFAQERLQEVSELIEEFRLEQEAQAVIEAENSNNSTETDTTNNTATSTSTSTDSNATTTQTHILEAEADVFTDVTIVKIELTNGTKELFETASSTTRVGVVDEIVNRFSLERDEVDSILNFEIEDRASREEDRNVGGNDDGSIEDNSDGDGVEIDDNNISLATSIALNFLADIKSDFVLNDNAEASALVDELLEKFNGRISDLPENVSIKIDLDQSKDRIRFEIKPDGKGKDKIRLRVDKNKIEFRDGDSRIKIEIKKDGRVKIKSENKKSDDHDGEDDSDDSDDDDNSDDDNDSDDNNSNDDDDDLDDDDDSDNDSSDDNDSDDDDNDSDDNNSNDDDDASNDDDDSDDNNSDDDSRDISQNSGNIKIKAEVKKGKTKVEVRIDGDKDKFTVDATVRNDVISHIASKYNLSTSSIESVIDFKE